MRGVLFRYLLWLWMLRCAMVCITAPLVLITTYVWLDVVEICICFFKRKVCPIGTCKRLKLIAATADNLAICGPEAYAPFRGIRIPTGTFCLLLLHDIWSHLRELLLESNGFGV